MRAQVNAYDGEPLARPRDVQVEQSEEVDEDGLSSLTLEMTEEFRLTTGKMCYDLIVRKRENDI